MFGKQPISLEKLVESHIDAGRPYRVNSVAVTRDRINGGLKVELFIAFRELKQKAVPRAHSETRESYITEVDRHG